MEIVPKRKWQYPISIEREYARLLTAYVDKELEIVEEFLPDMVDSVYRNSVHNDAIGDWLGNLVDRVQKKVKEKLTPLAAIRKTFQQVNKFVSTQMAETVESLFGSKPRQFNNTRQFEMIQTIWTSQNLELVKSIDSQIMDKIRFMMSQRIIHAAEKPELKEQLIQEIQDLAKVTRNRAALIAADQVGKLNSQLTQYRQVNAGIEEYIWNTRKDNRVRPAHISREGKKYKWSEPPSDGHPGWPIRCRCTALPVVDTDKTMLKPKTGSYSSVNSAIQDTPTGSIINSVNSLAEAKKRDKKIPITDVAIQKVRKVRVPGFTEIQNANLQYEHKKLLEYAMTQNNSDEVMGITSLDFAGVLYSKGSEELVGLTPQMESYMRHLPRNEGIIIHNHPKTKSFSFRDIGFLVANPQIGIMTAVSNQGYVHILCKGKDFSRAKFIDYVKQLRVKYDDDFDAVMKELLKNSRKAGITYVRG